MRCCSTRMRRHLEKAVSAGCVHGTYMAALLKKLTNGCLRSFTVVRQHPFNIPRDDDRARQCPRHCRQTSHTQGAPQDRIQLAARPSRAIHSASGFG